LRFQHLDRFGIAIAISLNFWAPKIESALRQLPFRAAMSMPKTPVNEHHGFMLSQYNIGLARQFLPLEAKSQAHPVKQFSNDQLGAGVAAPHAPHDITALLGRTCIHRTVNTDGNAARVHLHLD
jgi:hypothetical protein